MERGKRQSRAGRPFCDGSALLQGGDHALHPLRHALITAAVLFAALALLAAPALAVKPPKVTAALGDSITRAFNSEINPPTCPLFLPSGLLDCPKNSWSTGTNPAVNSQFQRVQAIDPERAPVAFNDARSGARAVDLLVRLRRRSPRIPTT